MDAIELMTTNEVAALLRRPPGTLRYWRHRGEGPPSFRVGQTVVYDRADVMAWIGEQRATTSTPVRRSA